MAKWEEATLVDVNESGPTVQDVNAGIQAGDYTPLASMAEMWPDISTPSIKQQVEDEFAVATQRNIPLEEAGEIVKERTWVQDIKGALTKGGLRSAKAVLRLPGQWNEALEKDWFAPKVEGKPFTGYLSPDFKIEGQPGQYKIASGRGITEEEFARLTPEEAKGWRKYGTAWSGSVSGYPGTLELASRGIEEVIQNHPEWDSEPPKNVVDLITSPRKLTTAIAESIPMLVGSGLLTLSGHPLAAATFMYATEGEEAHDNVIALGGTEEQAKTARVVYGLPAAALEMFQLQKGIKLAKEMRNLVLAKSAKKLAAMPLEQATREGIVSTVVQESVTEMMQGAWQEKTENIVADITQPDGWKGYIDRRLQEAVVAGVLTLGAGGLGAALGVTQRGRTTSEPVIGPDGWTTFTYPDNESAETGAMQMWSYVQQMNKGGDIQVERKDNVVRVRTGEKGELAGKQPTVKKEEDPVATKERELYDHLLEKAEAGDEQAWDQLNAMQQRLNEPTYEELLDRALGGDEEAAKAIQEGRYRATPQQAATEATTAPTAGPVEGGSPVRPTGEETAAAAPVPAAEEVTPQLQATGPSTVADSATVQNRPVFVTDDKGNLARVVRWTDEGKPVVVYPGKSGGVQPGTAAQGKAGRAYEYILDVTTPATADDFSKQIRPGGSQKQIELRMWRDEFARQVQQETASMREAVIADAAKGRRREILKDRVERGEDIAGMAKDIAEFRDEPWAQEAISKIEKGAANAVTVQRYEEPGVEPTTDKPQGLYLTPGNVESPHAKYVGGEKTTYTWHPQKSLAVTGELKVVTPHRRGVYHGQPISASAGIKALKKLVGGKEFKRLLELPKSELLSEMQQKYPNVNWTRYFDGYEILEGYAGLLARERGYDAIVDETGDEFAERIALSDSALTKLGQEGAKQAVQGAGAAAATSTEQRASALPEAPAKEGAQPPAPAEIAPPARAGATVEDVADRADPTTMADADMLREMRENYLLADRTGTTADTVADLTARNDELKEELVARGHEAKEIKEIAKGKRPIPVPVNPMQVQPQSNDPITTAEKNYLRDMGFTVADILKMKPSDAREKIALHRKASHRAGGFLRFNFNRQADTAAKIDKAMADFAKWLGVQQGTPEVSTVERIEPETLEGPWDEAKFRKDFEKKFGRPPSDEIVAKTKRMYRDIQKERKFVTTLKRQGLVPETVEAQYHVRNTDALAVKAANLVRDDISSAEKMAMEGTDDNSIAVLNELLKEYNRRQAAAETQAEKEQWSAKMIDITLRRAPVLTEHGRAVQMASSILLNTPEGLVNFAAKTVEQYNAENPSKKIPGLTPGQVSYWLDELRAIDQMPETNWKEQRTKMKRFGKVLDNIQSLVPSAWWDKVMAVIKAGLLTGLKTSGLNTASNLMHGMTEIAKDAPAIGIDMVQSIFTGKRTVAFIGKGWVEGFKKGWHEGWTYFQTGWSERDNIAQKLDWKRTKFDSWFGRTVLKPYVDFVFRALGAEDQPFYYGAMYRSLAGQAVAKAMNDGLKGDPAKAKAQEYLDNPTDEMLAYAVVDAETAVFQNRTALGDIANYITRKIPGAELVIPFKRTPSSIAMQILNYTPAGAVKGLIDNWQKYDQRMLSQELGRAAVGTTGLWIGYELFKLGLISLDRPETERERELWKLEGREANSIRIGDKWRSIQVLGPVGSVLIIGGHIANGMRRTGSPTQAFVEAWAGGAKSFSEQTFLRGLNVAVEAVTRPERSIENFTSSMAGMVVPTLLADIARATDEVERRQAGLGLERVMSRIPGARQMLEPQVTVFGQDLPRYGGNILEVMVDPTRPAKVRHDAVVDEIRRLYNLGHTVAAPTLMGDRDGYEGLTDEQNTELWRRAGEQTYMGIWETMHSDEYITEDDAGKAKLIDRAVDKGKTMARAEMAFSVLERTPQNARLLKEIELREGGLITNDVKRLLEKLR